MNLTDEQIKAITLAKFGNWSIRDTDIVRTVLAAAAPPAPEAGEPTGWIENDEGKFTLDQKEAQAWIDAGEDVSPLYEHPANPPVQRDAEPVLAQLVDALEHARAGLLWYHDRFPEVVDGSDDEAMGLIDAALSTAKEGQGK